jgi:hypothetical protein
MPDMVFKSAIDLRVHYKRKGEPQKAQKAQKTKKKEIKNT